MKVLFIGEGKHELGEPNPAGAPRAATGVLPTLVRKISPAIATDSIAMAWRELTLIALPRTKDTRKLGSTGYNDRVKRAILLAERKFDCKGLICVADSDQSAQFLDSQQEYEEIRRSIAPSLRFVAGLAVMSIDAWTLGVPEAIADVLSVPVEDIQGLYKLGRVEKYFETSGNEDHRPKVILNRICDLAHQHDGTEFRVRVAERTDIRFLEDRCRDGFAPFAKCIREVFGA